MEKQVRTGISRPVTTIRTFQLNDLKNLDLLIDKKELNRKDGVMNAL